MIFFIIVVVWADWTNWTDWFNEAYEVARGTGLVLDSYLAAAVADAGIGIVDATELPGGDALDGVVGVDGVEAALVVGLKTDGALHEVVDVAYLELDGHRCAFGERLRRDGSRG